VVGTVVFLYKLALGTLPEAKRTQVEKVVGQVVSAVEQAQALVPSQVKKDYATNMVNTLLAKAGVKASPELVDTLIESAVFALNQQKTSSSKTAVIPVVK